MTKTEIGQAIFNEIKAHIYASGYGMRQERFPPDFPVSRPSCYNIRLGKWTPETLDKLPFKVTVNYQIEIQKQK